MKEKNCPHIWLGLPLFTLKLKKNKKDSFPLSPEEPVQSCLWQICYYIQPMVMPRLVKHCWGSCGPLSPCGLSCFTAGNLPPPPRPSGEVAEVNQSGFICCKNESGSAFHSPSPTQQPQGQEPPLLPVLHPVVFRIEILLPLTRSQPTRR